MSAKAGDTVRVHYIGKLEDNSIFDSSLDHDPLEFTIGNQQVIKGFEDAVTGMEIGQQKIVKVSSENAYGPYYEELVAIVDRSQFPDDIIPEIGRQLQITAESGQFFLMRIVEVNEKCVTLDANHPLAGKDLTFEINLIAII